jgi:anti-anti-sigma factor
MAALLPMSALVIQLDGEFDIAELDRLNDAFAVAANAAVVVVDFERVTLMDSNVVRRLLELQAAVMRRGGRLTLTGLRSSPRRVFDICRLERVFDVRSTLRSVPNVDWDEAPTLRLVSQ